MTSSSFVSLTETEVRTRLTETLELHFASLLRLTQIPGTTAYVLLIAFGAACGGEFEPEIYKLCIEYLAQTLDGLDFDEEWSAIKTSFLIEMTSCVLPSHSLKEEFEIVTSKFCDENVPKNYMDVASVCYVHLLDLLEINL